jgi:MYXO-CTERM domain-containing protein
LIALLGTGLTARTAHAGETTRTIEGVVPDDGLDHFFVAFDVPPGITEIQIDHDDLSAANILDWGLQGPDGSFRGWGGGNTEPAIVGLTAASRSYLPGPIPAGTWAVVVGKAKVVESPAPYTITITLRDGDSPVLMPQPDRGPYAPVQLESAARWYAGDFHVHSLESGDARPPLDEIATFARGRGLDFVLLSEHNTNSGVDFVSAVQARHPELLLIPGAEFTTYAGHANAIGATAWVDHKIGQPGVTIEGAARAYRDAGALFAINHPTLNLGDVCIGCGWEQPLDGQWIDAVEVTTGGIDGVAGLLSPGAVQFWDELCAQGHHVAAIGGSDDHQAGQATGATASPIGSPTVMVFAEELSVAGIVAAVRAGRTVVKLQGPDDPMIEALPSDPLEGDTVEADATVLEVTVTGGDGYELRLVSDGRAVAAVPVSGPVFTFGFDLVAPELDAAPGQGRHRVELWRDNERRVITSHVWLVRPSGGAETTGSDPTGSTGDTTAATGPESSSDGATFVTGDSGAATTAGDTAGAASGDSGGAAPDSDAGGCGCSSSRGAAGATAPVAVALLLLALGRIAPRRRRCAGA